MGAAGTGGPVPPDQIPFGAWSQEAEGERIAEVKCEQAVQGTGMPSQESQAVVDPINIGLRVDPVVREGNGIEFRVGSAAAGWSALGDKRRTRCWLY